MPRANRHFLLGHVWHITHRCHEREFLLKFARDRATYLRWLFEARKRYGLCVLNYMVTSNHVHLLVRDGAASEIAQSMQLIAGRSAQQYNARKGRQGAFWQDRYHATAIEADEHLHCCLVYVDLNMVRAGIVRHPAEWAHGGYREIQNPPERYRIIDWAKLSALCGFSDVPAFHAAHRTWEDEALACHGAEQDKKWTRSIAVGSAHYVESVRAALALEMKALHREIVTTDSGHVLREPPQPYGVDFDAENNPRTADNTILWDESGETTTIQAGPTRDQPRCQPMHAKKTCRYSVSVATVALSSSPIRRE